MRSIQKPPSSERRFFVTQILLFAAINNYAIASFLCNNLEAPTKTPEKATYTTNDKPIIRKRGKYPTGFSKYEANTLNGLYQTSCTSLLYTNCSYSRGIHKTTNVTRIFNGLGLKNPKNDFVFI